MTCYLMNLQPGLGVDAAVGATGSQSPVFSGEERVWSKLLWRNRSNWCGGRPSNSLKLLTLESNLL